MNNATIYEPEGLFDFCTVFSAFYLELSEWYDDANLEWLEIVVQRCRRRGAVMLWLAAAKESHVRPWINRILVILRSPISNIRHPDSAQDPGQRDDRHVSLRSR